MKQAHSPSISNEAIVIPCSLKLGFQCFHRLPQLLVSVFLNPLFHALDGRQVLLGGCPAFDSGLALAAGFPVEFKTQEIKPSVMGASIAPKAQRLGFVGCYFQTKLGQPWF